MTTKNPRINVTFEKVTVGVLTHLAHKENKSIARLIRELAINALEMREDLYLSKAAEKLDKKNAKRYKHSEVWK